MKKFDPKKPVRTRDGKPARILCTDLKSTRYPMAVAILWPTTECGVVEHESIFQYSLGGKFVGMEDNPMNLVNIPVRKSFFENVWPDPNAARGRFTTLKAANESAANVKRFDGRVRYGVVELVTEDGELVDAIVHTVTGEV